MRRSWLVQQSHLSVLSSCINDLSTAASPNSGQGKFRFHLAALLTPFRCPCSMLTSKGHPRLSLKIHYVQTRQATRQVYIAYPATEWILKTFQRVCATALPTNCASCSHEHSRFAISRHAPEKIFIPPYSGSSLSYQYFPVHASQASILGRHPLVPCLRHLL